MRLRSRATDGGVAGAIGCGSGAPARPRPSPLCASRASSPPCPSQPPPCARRDDRGPADSHGKDPRCGQSIPLGHLACTVSCRLEKAVPTPRPGHTLDARHGRRPSVSITDMARHTAIFALAVRSRVPIATSRPRRSRRATHPDRFDDTSRRRRSVQNLSRPTPTRPFIRRRSWLSPRSTAPTRPPASAAVTPWTITRSTSPPPTGSRSTAPPRDPPRSPSPAISQSPTTSTSRFSRTSA